MFSNCVISPAHWEHLREEFPGDSPCEHCPFHKYGCPDKKPFEVGFQRFVAIEQSPDELPKCGIWCKNCKDTSGKIIHKTLWNGKPAFAVKCHCGETFLLYESKVHREYTGFFNLKGDYVPPVRYGTQNSYRFQKPILRSELSLGEDKTVWTTDLVQADSTPTAMELALKKAGLL